MLRTSFLASALALALFGQPARGQQGANTTPVTLPPALKTPLLKRVTIEKPFDADLVDVVKKLADDHKVKIEIDPEFLKGLPKGGKLIIVPAVKGVRLDVLLTQLIQQQGGTATCVVKKDVLVFVPPEGAVVTRPNKTQAYQVVLQPPDATHTAAVAALKKKLATKIDIEKNLDGVPLAEFLAWSAKKHDLQIVLRDDLFKAEGTNDIQDAKLTVKAAKGVAIETILRDALKGSKAVLQVDPYGTLVIIPAPSGPNS